MTREPVHIDIHTYQDVVDRLNKVLKESIAKGGTWEDVMLDASIIDLLRLYVKREQPIT